MAGTHAQTSLLMPHGLATTTAGHRAAVGCAEWLGAAAVDRDRWPAAVRRAQNWPRDIAARWVAENARVYCKTGKLVEKYNVRDAGEGAGGEYPVQDGFGWTNAVLIKLLAIYPKLSRPRYEFTGAGC